MPSTRVAVVAAMTAAIPPGLTDLDGSDRSLLRELTDRLIDTADFAEYARYRAIQRRRLVDEWSEQFAHLRSQYAGKRIVVTGGSGCIGSELVRQLLRCEPSDLVSVDLPGETGVAVTGVRYVELDIADERSTRQAFRRARPDVVFHCAAQRSPWLAERQIARTLLSNVAGTRSVLRAAREVEPERFVHASTGKAMRYRTSDIYAASKKIAECLVRDYAAEGRPTALARFTHVVDNAVVLQRIDAALAQRPGVIRVHDADLRFYAQSAAESATLLMIAGIQACPELHAVALRDLDQPVDLLDLVLGHVAARRSSGDEPIIYFSGFDRGYEAGSAPGLYDPATAFDLSPLINAIEARTARPAAGFDSVDEFRLGIPAHGTGSAETAQLVTEACRFNDEAHMRRVLASSSARQAEAMFRTCPEQLFAHLDSVAKRAGARLPTSRTPAHRSAA